MGRKAGSLLSGAVTRPVVSASTRWRSRAPPRLGGQPRDDNCQRQVSDWTSRSPRRRLASSNRQPPTSIRPERTAADSLKRVLARRPPRSADGRYRVFPNVGCPEVQRERLQSGRQIIEVTDRRRPIAARQGILVKRPLHFGSSRRTDEDCRDAFPGI